MCGITGYKSSNPKIDSLVLKRMTDKVIHRGPDADGSFVHKNVGLGHRRLSIIDLSETANQPMTSKCGRYTMVFNGEVYNYKEIRNKLNLNLKTNSDSEVILEAFALKGVQAISLFNGMFVIAIYDKEEGDLYLIKDRMGIKPLYYYYNDKTLLFASELKAISCLKDDVLDLSLNKNAIFDYLNLGYIPQPKSIYSEVSKLPNGHILKLNNKFELTISCYWNIEDKYDCKTITDYTIAKKELKSQLIKSVNYRLISDVSVGTFLSGGVDSSLITAMANELTNGNINTFSIGFKESKYDESKYAKAISKYLKTNHHSFVVLEQDALDILPEYFIQYDEPFTDSSALPTMLVSKLAKQNVTVTLSGDGADELFFGYDRVIRSKLFLKSKGVFNNLVSSKIMEFIPSRKAKRLSYMLSPYPKGKDKAHFFSQESGHFSNFEIEQILDLPTPNDNSSDRKNKIARNLTEREGFALFEINKYLINNILTKVDRASMYYSLESRVPFLDHNFIETAINIDENLKYRNKSTKFILKELLYEYVPKELFDRPKQGFSIPLSKWLLTSLRPYIEKYLCRSAIKETAIFNFSSVNQYVNLFLNENQKYSFLSQRIWTLIVIQKWIIQNDIRKLN